MIRALTDEAKDERRQAILDAALSVFFEQGFKAARMDDIARRAKLSKGALYLYFETKEALFAALIEAVAAPNVDRLEDIVAAAPTVSDALRGLTAFAPQAIRDTSLPLVLKVLIGDAGRFPEMVETYRRRVIDRGFAAITGLLTRGRASGEITIDDPQLTARLIIAPIILSAIWHVVFETDNNAVVDLDALFRLHEKMLRAGLHCQEKGIQ